ncbi:hypothetical protein GCM10009104_33570 [Marinobacterium maritimum]|uniref:Inner membrane protein n=1 Tax=Marinobacterium maritimum TaxID=500162 RepID=A0ABP3TGU0_9GAMM
MADPHTHRPLRWLWLLLTWLCIALALAGALLPGLPTTIFILLAAGCASRCSPRLRLWLQQHPLFGERLRNWEQGGYIDRRTKWVASAGMLTALAIVLITISHPVLLAAILLFIATGALVVWSRPEPISDQTAWPDSRDSA